MARRKSKGGHGLWLILAAVIVIGAGAILFTLFADSTRSIAALPIKEYVVDAKSYSGNHYKVSGNIDSLLGTGSAGERVVSLRVDNNVIAVLVPKEMASVNLEKGQGVTIVGKVKTDGIFLAESSTKR